MYTDPPRKLDYEVVSASLTTCWPNKFGSLDEESAKNFINKSAKWMKEGYGLRGPDLLCTICLAPFFGIGFLGDPLYPWARNSMNLEKGTDRRHALGQGVLNYFQSLKGAHHE